MNKVFLAVTISIVIFFIIAMIAFSMWSQNVLQSNIEQIKKNPVKTQAIARIVETKRNVYYAFDWEVNGKKYSGQIYGPYKCKNGEEITIYYLKDNPNFACFEKEFEQ